MDNKKYIKLLKPKPTPALVVFGVNLDELSKVIEEVIGNKTGIKISFNNEIFWNVDDDTGKIHLGFKEENISEVAWEKINKVYNIQEWFITTDQLLSEVFGGIETGAVSIYEDEEDPGGDCILYMEYSKYKKIEKYI